MENLKDPLYRFFEREVAVGVKLLTEVRRDLEDVILICQAQKRQTNHHRVLTSNLMKGVLPDGWKKVREKKNFHIELITNIIQIDIIAFKPWGYLIPNLQTSGDDLNLN